MSAAPWAVLLLLVFVACRRSGRVLSTHYADRAEIAAVAVVALCVLVPIALGAGSATLAGIPVRLPLAAAIVGGLLATSPTRSA